MKLSILFFPNIGKRHKKTGKIPMYMRITLNRQKAEMRLNIELQPSDLIKWDEKTMRFNDRDMSANALLNTLDKNFEDFRHHRSTSLSEYNAKSIRNLIMGLDVHPNPLILNYVDKYYNAAIAPNTEMAEGTKRNYRKALKHLKDFLIFRKTKEATLKDINMQFAFQFKDYLLGISSNERTGMKESSALDNIKRLRTIFDRAVDEKLLTLNYFKKIKLKCKSVKRARLDINQVKRICDLDLSQLPTQRIYRDMFLFSVFTGLAYTDAYSLKESDLNVMKDGNIKLYLKRAKTNIETEMILPKKAIVIIDKYKYSEEREITKALLPRRSNKEVNVQLKILANMAQVPIKLSTHIARHTFRQLLAEADIYEMGVIKRLMGHSNGNEIDAVYYSVTETRLLEAKRKFDLYLEKALL
ncbi:tyrosine-type recombinase/integrase [Ferruginibacter albus]|uniref:tyrosine-type recombinase/integrase n=1 Tax=Ferruginibacter albus TaxID=2875540 RepID=UPI001CC6BF7E|nr:site-specific integrase [Ferruginibacter albus]UAY53210.1 site-specific integrase [Ferruginibacter albus]